MLEEKFGAEITLENGSNGVFDVTVDGRLLFSKHSEGRFPEEGEVEQLLEEGWP